LRWLSITSLQGFQRIAESYIKVLAGENALGSFREDAFLEDPMMGGFESFGSRVSFGPDGAFDLAVRQVTEHQLDRTSAAWSDGEFDRVGGSGLREPINLVAKRKGNIVTAAGAGIGQFAQRQESGFIGSGGFSFNDGAELVGIGEARGEGKGFLGRPGRNSGSGRTGWAFWVSRWRAGINPSRQNPQTADGVVFTR
jgi:hypothetical protein